VFAVTRCKISETALYVPIIHMRLQHYCTESTMRSSIRIATFYATIPMSTEHTGKIHRGARFRHWFKLLFFIFLLKTTLNLLKHFTLNL